MPRTPTEILIFFILLAIILYIMWKKQRNVNYITTKKAKLLLHEIQEGYIELVDLVIHSTNKKELINFIYSLSSQNHYSKEKIKEDYAAIYLYEITEFIDSNKDERFITSTDWNTSVEDVVRNIKKHFIGNELASNPLTSLGEPIDVSISAEGAFSDINDHLKSSEFKMGFIDNFSDSYQIIVYSIKDEDKVISTIRKIGLPFYQDIKT